MKLVSIFVPGALGDAIRFVNDHKVLRADNVVQLHAASRTNPVPEGEGAKPWPTPGFAIIVSVTAQVADVLVKQHGDAVA